MRKVFLSCCLLCFSLAVLAQKTSTKKSSVWSPWGVAEAGVVWGSYEANGDLRLQGGVSKNDWKYGVGLAKDVYRFSSVPIYLQVRRSFLRGKRRPFLLASAGYNLATESDYTNPFMGIWWGTPTTYQYTSGYYGELGAGYSFRSTKKWGYTLSFSYTRKTMSENYNTVLWNGTDSETSETRNIFRMNRFAIRLGIRIGGLSN